MFEPFYGNQAVTDTLAQMLRQDRIPQTILLAGPEGIGKATLARRFAAELIGGSEKIEQDDLSRPENLNLIAEREKLAAEKRTEDPLLFASHPDFITFAPDGPLRQISIQQMRLLKEKAQFQPLHGRYRVFLIDHLNRANEQAANSLLKILEEPPAYLILFATAENPYDLLPTIRSRSAIFQMAPLSQSEMEEFGKAHNLADMRRRVALSGGSPGVAISLDLDVYDKRRAAMLSLLQAASGKIGFAEWAKVSEAVGAARSEKLDSYLKILYGLLEDVVLLRHGIEDIRNIDIRRELDSIASSVSFDWIRKAVARIDELVEMARRSIQKTIALDALVIELNQNPAA
jgi:DNA polymerase-3 subunit delta'